MAHSTFRKLTGALFILGSILINIPYTFLISTFDYPDIASLVYLMAQTELFATVIPGFPVAPEAGLVGSLLWLGWMLVMGIVLARAKFTAAENFPS